MIRRYIEQILNLYNYIDGLMVTNSEGIVEYYTTYRPDINNLREEEVRGKHVCEIYPDLNEETSSIMRVLKTGQPIYNEKQNLKTYKGQNICAVNTTLPIKYRDKIIGAVDISRYVDPEMVRKEILLFVKEKQSVNSKYKLYTLDDIITNSPLMLEIKEIIRKVSKTDSSVLIYGETGTGKELVAQAIHSHSPRRREPFISQNCAAIPSTLLESILFGTIKGSYTGAENRKGLFELADGGTLFLDEINSMEIEIQPKLLKAIEEKRITRIGGLKPIDVNVRIVSAMNEKPIEAVSNNKLREDLYYRIGVVEIHLPKLKDRKEDIKLLTKHFIEMYNMEMNKNIVGITEDVEDIFYNYSWPGNVRELRNVIERAFNLTSGRLIQLKDLPYYMRNNKVNINDFNINLGEKSLSDYVEDFERGLIQMALDRTSSFTEAAELLRISKQALNYKMHKYNLY